jgi:amidohydrolase
MSIDVKLLKDRAIARIDEVRDELTELSDRIQANPETAYQEFKAASWLSQFLEEHGFSVEREAGGLPTAFVATCEGKAPGPTLAFLAEYDALPEVGHGCGHNLIGVGAVGAGAGLASQMADLGGTIKVIGTPAEEFTEGKAGKIRLLEEGAFSDIDIALMFHPWTVTAAATCDFGFIVYDVTFRGKTAHAAADPWNGKNALDAVVLTYNNIGLLRQQLKPDARVHQIITHGGDAANVIPDQASIRVMFRSIDPSYLEELEIKVLSCVRGAAEASGTEVETQKVTHVKPSRFNPELYQIAKSNMAALGESLDTMGNWGCSSDFGNVSQMLPSIYLLIETHDSGINWHSDKVSRGSRTPKAHDGMILMAKTLAMSAVDLLADPQLIMKAKEAWGSAG